MIDLDPLQFDVIGSTGELRVTLFLSPKRGEILAVGFNYSEKM